MKMDIEGSEYQVLPDLLATGVLCHTINGLFGEWHTDARPTLSALRIYRNWDTLLAQMMAITISRNDYKFDEFIDFDNESYLMDSIPLHPSAPWWEK